MKIRIWRWWPSLVPLHPHLVQPRQLHMECGNGAGPAQMVKFYTQTTQAVSHRIGPLVSYGRLASCECLVRTFLPVIIPYVKPQENDVLPIDHPLQVYWPSDCTRIASPSYPVSFAAASGDVQKSIYCSSHPFLSWSCSPSPSLSPAVHHTSNPVCHSKWEEIKRQP